MTPNNAMHAVIFDIDGTLIQSAAIDDQLYRQSVTHVLGPVRFRPSLADYEFVTDSGILSQVIADNDITIGTDPAESIKSRFVAGLQNHIAEHGHFIETTGAKSLLAKLRSSKNHSVAIATGGWRVTAELKLRSAKFDTNGIPIATSDNEHDRTRIMLSALSALGRSFESITYYGDGTWDRDACNKLGWGFIPVGPALSGLESFSATSVA